MAIIVKYTCDICGKDAPETKFIVPVFNREVFDRIKMMGYYDGKESKIKTAELNLCNKHQNEVACALL